MYLLLALIGIFFLGWDLYKANKYKLIFAASFLFSSITLYKYPDKYLFSILGFILFALSFYILITAIYKKEQKDIIKDNSTKNFISKIATVKKDIGKTLSIDGLGCIEFDNQLWSAKSIDDKEIKAGQKVQIVSKENMIMNVKVIENADK